MLEKIKRRILILQWKLYHKLGDYCFNKVDEYDSNNNDYWLSLTEYFTIKEFEIVDKLFPEETYI